MIQLLFLCLILLVYYSEKIAFVKQDDILNLLSFYCYRAFKIILKYLKQ